MIVGGCMYILGLAMSWAPGVWVTVGEKLWYAGKKFVRRFQDLRVG
jgi:hypothetical protein